MDPQTLYVYLGRLVADTPDLADGPITPEKQAWLGKLLALAPEVLDANDLATLKIAVQHLDTINRRQNALTIAALAHAALVRAELRAPAGMQGAFIGAGQTFDAFAAVSRVLAQAKRDALLLDPYADHVILTDYAPMVAVGITVRLLTDEAKKKSTLEAAARHWVHQHGTSRPLEIRLAASRTLHDRFIVVDGAQVYTVGQSFRGLAEHALTSVNRVMDPTTTQDKIDAFAQIWITARPFP